MYSILTLPLSGIPDGPAKVASTNANQALPATIVANDSRNAIRVVITCETAAIRYACGGIIPVMDDLGHVLAANESLVIGHPAGISSFRFCSAAANTHATVQITGEYGAE